MWVWLRPFPVGLVEDPDWNVQNLWQKAAGSWWDLDDISVFQIESAKSSEAMWSPCKTHASKSGVSTAPYIASLPGLLSSSTVILYPKNPKNRFSLSSTISNMAKVVFFVRAPKRIQGRTCQDARGRLGKARVERCCRRCRQHRWEDDEPRVIAETKAIIERHYLEDPMHAIACPDGLITLNSYGFSWCSDRIWMNLM